MMRTVEMTEEERSVVKETINVRTLSGSGVYARVPGRALYVRAFEARTLFQADNTLVIRIADHASRSGFRWVEPLEIYI